MSVLLYIENATCFEPTAFDLTVHLKPHYLIALVV